MMTTNARTGYRARLGRWLIPLACASLLVCVLGQVASSPGANDPATHLARGDRFCAAQQWDDGIREYTRAIELKPDYAQAFNNRGFARYAKQDGTDAIPDLTRAIELREAFPHAYNTRGCAHLAAGNTARALADFDRAIELQPDYGKAYRNRGNAHLRLGQVRLAIADFERAGAHPKRLLLVLCVCGVLVLTVLVGTIYFLRPSGSSGRRPNDSGAAG